MLSNKLRNFESVETYWRQNKWSIKKHLWICRLFWMLGFSYNEHERSISLPDNQSQPTHVLSVVIVWFPPYKICLPWPSTPLSPLTTANFLKQWYPGSCDIYLRKSTLQRYFLPCFSNNWTNLSYITHKKPPQAEIFGK